MSEHEVPEWMIGGGGLEEDLPENPSTGGGSRNIRHWMKKNTERRLVFLTNGGSAPAIWEHQVYLDGNWRNWHSCLQTMGMPCPLCQFAAKNKNKYSRKAVRFFTVIDVDGYTNRDGIEVKNQRRLLAAKKGTVEILKRRFATLQKQGKDLRGAMFNVYRSNEDKGPSVGTDFEYMEHVDLSDYPETDEFDYAELLAPDVDAVKAAAEKLYMVAGGGGSAEGTDTQVDF